MEVLEETLRQGAPPVNLGALQKVIAEEVKKAMGDLRKEVQEVRKEVQTKGLAPAATTQARSWAAVVAGEGDLPKKIIPGRLNKEMMVRGSTEPSLVRRSPQEIVQAVNGVSERKGLSQRRNCQAVI